jgi:hypothetical protein
MPSIERRVSEYLLHNPNQEVDETKCQIICESKNPEQYACFTLVECRRNPNNR